MEPVLDKERANYCDFFSAAKSGAASVGPESDAFEKLNNLFK
jgi:hypothetical protein